MSNLPAPLAALAVRAITYPAKFQPVEKTAAEELARQAVAGGPQEVAPLANLVFVTISFWATLHAWRQESALTGLLVVGGVLGAFSVAFGARMFRAPAR